MQFLPLILIGVGALFIFSSKKKKKEEEGAEEDYDMVFDEAEAFDEESLMTDGGGYAGGFGEMGYMGMSEAEQFLGVEAEAARGSVQARGETREAGDSGGSSLGRFLGPRGRGPQKRLDINIKNAQSANNSRTFGSVVKKKL